MNEYQTNENVALENVSREVFNPTNLRIFERNRKPKEKNLRDKPPTVFFHLESEPRIVVARFNVGAFRLVNMDVNKFCIVGYDDGSRSICFKFMPEKSAKELLSVCKVTNSESAKVFVSNFIKDFNLPLNDVLGKFPVKDVEIDGELWFIVSLNERLMTWQQHLMEAASRKRNRKISHHGIDYEQINGKPDQNDSKEL